MLDLRLDFSSRVPGLMEEFSGFGEEEVDFSEVEVNGSSLFCAARDLAASNASSSFLEDKYALRSYLFCFYSLLLVLGLCLNGTVVWLVVKYPKLRTPDLAIALQIVGINFAILILSIFLSLINIAAGKWILSRYECVIQGFLHLVLRSVRQFLLVAMALDRFLLVFYPFGYPKRHSRGAFLLSCVCWLAAFALCLPYLPGILDCYSFASFNYYCVIRSACSNPCRYVSYFRFIVVSFPSFALPVILYSAMYVKARKMKLTSITAEHAASTTKANVTMFLIFITCFLCNAPTIGGIILIQMLVRFYQSHYYVWLAYLLLDQSIFFILILTPIVILRNRDLKEALKKTWNMKCKKHLSN